MLHPPLLKRVNGADLHAWGPSIFRISDSVNVREVLLRLRLAGPTVEEAVLVRRNKQLLRDALATRIEALPGGDVVKNPLRTALADLPEAFSTFSSFPEHAADVATLLDRRLPRGEEELAFLEENRIAQRFITIRQSYQDAVEETDFMKLTEWISPEVLAFLPETLPRTFSGYLEHLVAIAGTMNEVQTLAMKHRLVETARSVRSIESLTAFMANVRSCSVDIDDATKREFYLLIKPNLQATYNAKVPGLHQAIENLEAEEQNLRGLARVVQLELNRFPNVDFSAPPPPTYAHMGPVDPRAAAEGGTWAEVAETAPFPDGRHSFGGLSFDDAALAAQFQRFLEFQRTDANAFVKTSSPADVGRPKLRSTSDGPRTVFKTSAADFVRPSQAKSKPKALKPRGSSSSPAVDSGSSPRAPDLDVALDVDPEQGTFLPKRGPPRCAWCTGPGHSASECSQTKIEVDYMTPRRLAALKDMGLLPVYDVAGVFLRMKNVKAYPVVSENRGLLPIFDSGCGPEHALPGPLPSTPQYVRVHTATGEASIPVGVGQGIIKTMSTTGLPLEIGLPGVTQTSPSFHRPLISAGTLLKNGYEAEVQGSHGILTCPPDSTGFRHKIFLDGSPGYYTFPGESASGLSFAPWLAPKKRLVTMCAKTSSHSSRAQPSRRTPGWTLVARQPRSSRKTAPPPQSHALVSILRHQPSTKTTSSKVSFSSQSRFPERRSGPSWASRQCGSSTVYTSSSFIQDAPSPSPSPRTPPSAVVGRSPLRLTSDGLHKTPLAVVGHAPLRLTSDGLHKIPSSSPQPVGHALLRLKSDGLHKISTQPTSAFVKAPAATQPSASSRSRSQAKSGGGSSNPPTSPAVDDVRVVTPPPVTPLSPATLKDFDKIKTLHAAHGHPALARMKLIFQGLDPSDPSRLTSQASLGKWFKYHKCSPCLEANLRRPSHSMAHPPRASPTFGPGEKLCLDSSGKYALTAPGGNTHSILATCEVSRIRWAFPVPTISDDTIITVLDLWTSHSPVPLRHLHVDAQFETKAVRQWCSSRQIALTGSSPDVHQQNGVAEATVRLVKDTARANAIGGGLSPTILDYNHAYSCIQLSRSPTVIAQTSPESRWPQAPFRHPQLRLIPFGCKAWGHTGRDPARPNTAARSTVGIFVGHDPIHCGYLLYHSDSQKVKTYAHAEFDFHSFPFVDQQLIGDRPATLMDHDWRRHANSHLRIVADEDAANYLVGKQVELTLPQKWYPQYPSTWRVRAQAVARAQTAANKGLVGLRVVMSHYNGDYADLSSEDLAALDSTSPLELVIPMSDLKPGQTTPPTWTSGAHHHVRDLITLSFPNARCLSDVAYESVSLTGYYPTHPALAPTTSAPPDANPAVEPPPAPAVSSPRPRGRPRKGTSSPKSKVVLPVRPVAGARNPKATWSSAAPSLRRDRTRYTRAAAPTPGSLAESSAHLCTRAIPSVYMFIAHDSTPLPRNGPLGFEPRSVREAKRHASWPLWDAAIRRELTGLVDRGTWSEVTYDDVPAGVNVMDSKIVLKDKKTTGPKARLVVRGDQQDPPPAPGTTYAPTPSATEVRTFFALATHRGWRINSFDISQAFVQAKALPDDANLFVRPPHGDFAPKGTLWKLHRPLYGLSVAPRSWSDTLKTFLLDFGFTRVNTSDCYYTWTDGTSHLQLVVHVDDICVSYDSVSALHAFRDALLVSPDSPTGRFEGTDEGPVTKYLGIDIASDGKVTHLSQEPLARDLLAKFGMEHCNPVLVPMEPNTLLSAADCPSVPDVARRQQYQELVGSLQYLCTWTRPDLVFATNQLARHSSNPGAVHMAAAMRVLRYLKGTADLGLTYSYDLPAGGTLTAWADADWAACLDTRRSFNCGVILLAGAAIHWMSAQQKSVAVSTAEAEFVSASRCADIITWIRNILEDAGAAQTLPTPLFEDNRACRLLSENPIQSRARHIDFRVMSLRERVAAGTVKVLDCASRDMVADGMTKNLPFDAFRRHRTTQLGSSPSK